MAFVIADPQSGHGPAVIGILTIPIIIDILIVASLRSASDRSLLRLFRRFCLTFSRFPMVKKKNRFFARKNRRFNRAFFDTREKEREREGGDLSDLPSFGGPSKIA